MNNYFNVNHVACVVTTGLAVATIGSTLGAVAAATVASKVGYTALAILSGSVSVGSITAWLDKSSESTEQYFSNLRDHSGIAIASMSQLVAQTLVQALIQGVATGVSKSISRSIAGEDVTVKVKKS